MKKKLFLNKQTITKLNILEKKSIKGGTAHTECDCDHDESTPAVCETVWPGYTCECLSDIDRLYCNPDFTNVC